MRDKDVLDVLAVLDVVQNLDTFQARLVELKAAEKALADQQEIVKTLEHAKKLHKEAEDHKAKAKSDVDESYDNLNEFESTKLKGIAAEEQRVNSLLTEVNDKFRSAETLVASVKDSLEYSKKRSSDLDNREASLAVQRKELEAKEAEHNKLKQQLRVLTNG